MVQGGGGLGLAAWERGTAQGEGGRRQGERRGIGKGAIALFLLRLK